MNAAKRGEVWLADLGEPKQDDHEQAGLRPAVVFQTDDLSPLGTVVIIPLTTQLKRAGFASTVLIPARRAGQERDSVALCHQIRAIDRRRLLRQVGEVAPDLMNKIETAVLFVLGIAS